jgi:hypothetical protein
MVLKIYNNLAIPLGPGERFTNIPMQARANPTFHGNPWYSDLAIQLEGAEEEEYTSFRLSCLFFKYQLFHTTTNNHVTKKLVFIQMYEVVLSNSLTELIGCNEVSLSNNWVVVESESILQLVHIVLNFAFPNSKWFFVNNYKF